MWDVGSVRMLFGNENDRRLGTPAPVQRLPRRAPTRNVFKDTETLGRAPRQDDIQEFTVAKPVTQSYIEAKKSMLSALFEAVDISAVSEMDKGKARTEVAKVVHELIGLKQLRLSTVEQTRIVTEICDELFGFGPLEPLLARQDIGDIMVNGPKNIFIEVGGVVEKTDVQFRDDEHLLATCKRIVSGVGRHVDSSNPVCDARLPDGSRVNVILPPLALKGPTLTIRKFKRDRLRLRDLVDFGSISPAGAKLLAIIAASQCNVIVSGGTGSGKTTLLNCMTAFFNRRERIITLEDAAELQLQQPHVVSLETRPPNTEGKGGINMTALMKNCLRMRPERIIVGEVRGPEALDLLQAMNTGHDGSMGTLHANTPRDAVSRIETMITMGTSALPVLTVREMIAGSVDIIVQTSRLRDGSRRITHVTEVIGMNGDVIVTQDLMRYEITGEDARGNITGQFVSTGIAKPKFYDKAAYFGLGSRLTSALEEAGVMDARPEAQAAKRA